MEDLKCSVCGAAARTALPAALEEIERLEFLHKQDHSLADQWRERAEKAEAQRDSLADTLRTVADECDIAEKTSARLEVERDDLANVLRFNGFVCCDVPACNCGSWHHRYGLPERWREICDALIGADVLDNGTGNIPLCAVKQLIAQRDQARAELSIEHERTERYITDIIQEAEREDASPTIIVSIAKAWRTKGDG